MVPDAGKHLKSRYTVIEAQQDLKSDEGTYVALSGERYVITRMLWEKNGIGFANWVRELTEELKTTNP